MVNDVSSPQTPNSDSERVRATAVVTTSAASVQATVAPCWASVPSARCRSWWPLSGVGAEGLSGAASFTSAGQYVSRHPRQFAVSGGDYPAPMPATEPTTLADQRFWEEEYYWARSELPCRPDPVLHFDRALGVALSELAGVGPGDSVIEIGCAPAKWLVEIAESTGARVEGVEYSERGAQLSQANLRACAVKGTIHHADFFAHPAAPYDLVLSLGFIEHFEDLDEVFARHLEFVRPGGRLLLGVPNFLGLNGFLQRHSDRSYLGLHNLRAMDPAELRRLGRDRGLELLDQRYLGGADAVIVKPGPLWVRGIVLAEGRLLRMGLTEGLNNRPLRPLSADCLRQAALLIEPGASPRPGPSGSSTTA